MILTTKITQVDHKDNVADKSKEKNLTSRTLFKNCQHHFALARKMLAGFFFKMKDYLENHKIMLQYRGKTKILQS